MLKKTLSYVGMFFAAVAIFLIIGILVLTFSAYMPSKVELAETVNVGSKAEISQTLRVLSFNTGSAMFDEGKTHFSEGGASVRPKTAKEVIDNTAAISEIIRLSKANAVLLKEVSTDSRTSHYLNQRECYDAVLGFSSSFTYDFKSKLLVYPKFIGEINSGLLTESDANIHSSERVSIGKVNGLLGRYEGKRPCVLVTRYRVNSSERELSLLNANLTDDNIDEVLAVLAEEREKGNYVILGISCKSDIRSFKDKIEKAGFTLCIDETKDSRRSLKTPYIAGETQTELSDGFIIGEDISVGFVKTVDQQFKFSNHNPIIAEFSLK